MIVVGGAALVAVHPIPNSVPAAPARLRDQHDGRSQGEGGEGHAHGSGA